MFKLRGFAPMVAMGAVLFMAPASMVSAQTPPPPPITIPPPAPSVAPYPDAQPAPEHFDLYAAIQESIDQETITDSVIEAMNSQLASDPTVSAMEAISPGLIEEYTTLVRPMLTAHSNRIQKLYRPRMATLFAQHLTAEEAIQAAAFYRSDFGKRLMGLASDNFTADAALEDAMESSVITRDQIDRDMDQMTASTIAQLTEADKAEMLRYALQNPAMFKLFSINEDIRALRVQMENEPLPPDFEQKAGEIMISILERRFPQ